MTLMIFDLATEKGLQGGMDLLVVQFCQEDADFNQKNRSPRSDKNAKVMRFKNFPNFA